MEWLIDNGMLRLVESLERKQATGDWVDHLLVRESNTAYEAGME